jgi:hypothetical protein
VSWAACVRGGQLKIQPFKVVIGKVGPRRTHVRWRSDKTKQTKKLRPQSTPPRQAQPFATRLSKDLCILGCVSLRSHDMQSHQRRHLQSTIDAVASCSEDEVVLLELANECLPHISLHTQQRKTRLDNIGSLTSCFTTVSAFPTLSYAMNLQCTM